MMYGPIREEAVAGFMVGSVAAVFYALLRPDLQETA